MARNLLSVREVQTATEGDYSDGDGLILRTRGKSAAWVFRYTSAAGKRREMGLGPVRRNNAAVAGASLTDARDDADRCRKHLREGLDPIDERAKHRSKAKDAAAAKKTEKQQQVTTLARAARAYHERVIEPNRTDKHGAQWIASLENHVPPALWSAPITSIKAPALLDFLIDMRRKVPETAQRVRQRLEAVFEDAAFRGQVIGNPAAAVKRKFREAQRRREKGEFAALPYAEAPAFMARLRECEGIAARCLELGVLTAARTGELIAAEWREFDLERAVWTVPAEKMKGGEAHTVYLSERAVEIVRGQAGMDERYVFPSPMAVGKESKPLSNMAMLVLLGRMKMRDRTTVHGLCRATFSTWANESGAARPDVIEACLAHEESNRVRAAYNRAQFTAERRALLQAWAHLPRVSASEAGVQRRRAPARSVSDSRKGSSLPETAPAGQAGKAEGRRRANADRPSDHRSTITLTGVRNGYTHCPAASRLIEEGRQ